MILVYNKQNYYKRTSTHVSIVPVRHEQMLNALRINDKFKCKVKAISCVGSLSNTECTNS